MTNQLEPLVSVKTLTYNHAAFIRQCIEGVLMQKTNFPFEYIIGEDCSTDGTREIVLDYARKYPEIIRVITSESNVGSKENSRRTNLVCRGKYLALCEGDDYWTDPYKLQKQADFLESHETYSICGHWVKNIDGTGALLEKQVFTGQSSPETFGVEDALEGTPIHTGSLMCRNSVLQQALRDNFDLMKKMPAGDDPAQLLLLTQGQGYCFQEFMGVYRIHSGGTWSTRPELIKRYKMLLFYYTIPRLIGNNNAEKVNQQIKAGEHAVAEVLLFANVQTLIEFFRACSRNELMPKKRIPVLAIKSFLYVMVKIIARPWNFTKRVIGRLRTLLFKRVHKS
jgi:glycosyltransferase involved in cell wall biosynthesis